MKSAKCSKLVQKLNIFLIIKFLQQYFIYDYFMRLFELVIEELICWRRHNTNPGYQV